MDVISILLLITIAVMLYFFFGIILKFIWGWLPLIIGTLLSISLILIGGSFNAILAIICFFISIILTNNWQGSNIYFTIEEKIEKLFYFND